MLLMLLVADDVAAAAAANAGASAVSTNTAVCVDADATAPAHVGAADDATSAAALVVYYS